MAIDAIARLNDETSHSIMQDRLFRDELRHWMRLSKNHPNWSSDGLNATALGLSAFEATGARFALSTPLFEFLDRVGVGSSLTAEAQKTRSSHYIAAFHRPENEHPLISGEAFYEMWLMLTSYGQAAWPMAALADDPDANTEVCRLMGVPEQQRLINVVRVGPLPNHTPTKARLTSTDLIDV